MQTYYEVFISAETQAQADKILNSLLEKKLATGGQFLQAPARFLWKGKITDMDYVTITSFTTAGKKEALIADVESTTTEDFPMIRFFPVEANRELAQWIDEILQYLYLYLYLASCYYISLWPSPNSYPNQDRSTTPTSATRP